MSGTPKFQYHIPYEGEDPIHNKWYIIITTTSRHFYYNSTINRSFWQLYDIRQQYQDLPWNHFIDAIEFDLLAVLFAKSKGLKGLDESFYYKKTVTSKKDQRGSKEVVPEIPSEKQPEAIEVNFLENLDKELQLDLEVEEEVDVEAQNAFIANLLQEEGFIKPVETVILGYSSSEEEEEEEEEGEEEKEIEDEIDEIEEESQIAEPTGQDTNNIDSNDLSPSTDHNIGLDLSLSDDETNDAKLTEIPESSKADFINVLNQLKPKISIYEPWSMVEEDLISELALFPGFYSIDDISQRELIFDEWCSQQETSPHPNQPEQIQTYPTPTIELYKFLQEYKRDIKLLYFQEFFNKHLEDFNDIDLSNKEMEQLYIKFKNMLSDFSKFEKSAKKEKGYDLNVNLKKLRLEQFLAEAEFNKNTREMAPSDPESTSFDKWIAILNVHDVPQHIAESNINFIVGDDKRLQCYQDILRKHET
jgi:hypothetical protein